MLAKFAIKEILIYFKLKIVKPMNITEQTNKFFIKLIKLTLFIQDIK